MKEFQSTYFIIKLNILQLKQVLKSKSEILKKFLFKCCFIKLKITRFAQLMQKIEPLNLKIITLSFELITIVSLGTRHLFIQGLQQCTCAVLKVSYFCISNAQVSPNFRGLQLLIFMCKMYLNKQHIQYFLLEKTVWSYHISSPTTACLNNYPSTLIQFLSDLTNSFNPHEFRCIFLSFNYMNQAYRPIEIYYNISTYKWLQFELLNASFETSLSLPNLISIWN